VKLTDFGIAKAADNRNVTRAGSVKGKIGYIAPEQYLAGTIDRRTDVFALGVVLYEMTTGRLPFSETDALALAQTVTSVDVPPPSTWDRSYPRELERIVLRAVERDPAARYGSAGGLRADLDRFAVDRELDLSARALAAYVADRLASPGSRPVGLPADPHSPAFATQSAELDESDGRRRKRWITFAVVAVVAAVGGLVLWMRPDEPAARRQAEPPVEPRVIAPAVRTTPRAGVDRETEPSIPATEPPSVEPTAKAVARDGERPDRRRSHRRRPEPAPAREAAPSARARADAPAADRIDDSPDAPFPGAWRPR
jgi:serine/threonine-protein kinase